MTATPGIADARHCDFRHLQMAGIAGVAMPGLSGFGDRAWRLLPGVAGFRDRMAADANRWGRKNR